MKSPKRIKVIFDTNIWISFLIGKQLQSIKALIAEKELSIVLTSKLFIEIETVTKRPKLLKYFPQNKVNDLIGFLKLIGEVYEITPKQKLCRDAKDNFLLDLIDQSKADFLITGDKDLIALNPFKTASIISPSEFITMLKKSKKIR